MGWACACVMIAEHDRGRGWEVREHYLGVWPFLSHHLLGTSLMSCTSTVHVHVQVQAHVQYRCNTVKPL